MALGVHLSDICSLVRTSLAAGARMSEAGRKKLWLLPNEAGGKRMAPEPRKWTLRRTMSVVLIVSGLFWLLAGIAIRLLLF
jgi:hypothetical protein